MLLTRTSAAYVNHLKIRSLALRERLGIKRAAVAVARKLAVIMNNVLKTGKASIQGGRRERADDEACLLTSFSSRIIVLMRGDSSLSGT